MWRRRRTYSRKPQRITYPQNRPDSHRTLEVFTRMIDRVQSAYDFDSETAIYLWGPAAHPELQSAKPCCCMWRRSRAMASLIDCARCSEILPFILDDRRLRKITFITDCLGVRPWFVGSNGGRLVCGSDVLKICKAGLSCGQADYDAISCWLKYNYTLNGASVVRDFQKPAAAAVSTFDTTGQLVSEVVYGEYGYGEEYLDPDQMADRQVDIASRSLAAATREVGEVNFLLSGGYDSRLLFALARRMGLRMRAQTIQTREYEVLLAKEVAAAMRHPIDVVASRKRIRLICLMILSPSTARGFVTGRNLTCMLAASPGRPLVSGFLGEAVMRDPLTPAGDRWWRINREKWGQTDSATLPDSRYIEHRHRLNLMNKSVADNIERRAMHGMQELVGRAGGRALLYADLHARLDVHREHYSAAPGCQRSDRPLSLLGTDQLPNQFQPGLLHLAKLSQYVSASLSGVGVDPPLNAVETIRSQRPHAPIDAGVAAFATLQRS